MRKILFFSAFMEIVIACLGLLDLALSTAEQHTKEIGIRKTLGASVIQILFLLSKDFTRWGLLANLVAWPVASLLLQQWLQNYAYRIIIGWGTFLAAGTLALLIALVTISFQAIRAARANPVTALRYE